MYMPFCIDVKAEKSVCTGTQRQQLVHKFFIDTSILQAPSSKCKASGCYKTVKNLVLL